jgi:hypothetical protein
MRRGAFGRLAFFWWWAALAVPAASTASAGPACLDDLDALPAYMRENDAGAAVHLANAGEAIEAAFRRARQEAAQVHDASICHALIARYLSAYRRQHLYVAPATPPGPGSAPTGVDTRLPRFRVLSPQTALLVVPSFFDHYRAPLLALLERHRREIAARPNLVIDLRHNNGGMDSTYQVLLPYVASGAAHLMMVEFLATPANITATEAICDTPLIADRPACRRGTEPTLTAMRQVRPGEFVRPVGWPAVATSRPAALKGAPRRIGILIDQPCGSSCEQFLLQARQSFKVKLYGRPTAGALDFSNLRPYPLPSGQRVLWYATSRSLRLPGFPIDLGGVQPDEYLPPPADDAGYAAELELVRARLESTR